MNKAALRQLYLAKRLELPSGELAAASVAVSDRLFEHLDFKAVQFLHTFLPIAKFAEIDTWQICRRIWREFPEVSIVVPRLSAATGEMDACLLGPASRLEVNKWGISEPAGGDLVEPLDLDVVLVPGLCFDARGHRVGYGKGFYDRFLRNTRPDCQKVGLSAFDLIDEIEDTAPSDVPVDAVITPAAYCSIP